MKKVIVSAPGKLHLSGEHAVVYGKPAVVVSTSRRLMVTLEAQGDAKKSFGFLRKKDVFINAVSDVFEKQYHLHVSPSLSLTIDSAIPVGSGMGSSAAVAVALTGALLRWHNLPWDPQRINELSYQAEKVKHVNSSGSDPAIVTHGGILWYRKELDFLKTFWLLPFKIPKSFAPFVLVNTKRHESTGDMVVAVSQYRARHIRTFPILMDQFEAVTKEMVQAIHDEKEQAFRAAFRENEQLLERIAVVSPSTKTFIRAVEKAGGVAKISGGGGKEKGSGIVIVMHEKPSVVIELAKTHHYPSFQVALGGEGVRLEQAII